MRQRQPPLEQRGGGFARRRIERRQERLLVRHFAAEGTDIRQQRRAPEARRKCLGQDEPGATGREDDGDVAHPERPLAPPVPQQRAIEHPLGERREKRRVGRDGEKRVAAHGRRFDSVRRGKSSGVGCPNRLGWHPSLPPHRVTPAKAGAHLGMPKLSRDIAAKLTVDVGERSTRAALCVSCAPPKHLRMGPGLRRGDTVVGRASGPSRIAAKGCVRLRTQPSPLARRHLAEP